MFCGHHLGVAPYLFSYAKNEEIRDLRTFQILHRNQFNLRRDPFLPLRLWPNKKRSLPPSREHLVTFLHALFAVRLINRDRRRRRDRSFVRSFVRTLGSGLESASSSTDDVSVELQSDMMNSRKKMARITFEGTPF